MKNNRKIQLIEELVLSELVTLKDEGENLHICNTCVKAGNCSELNSERITCCMFKPWETDALSYANKFKQESKETSDIQNILNISHKITKSLYSEKQFLSCFGNTEVALQDLLIKHFIKQKQDLIKLVQLARKGTTITSDTTGVSYWKFDIDSDNKVIDEYTRQ